MNAKNGVKLFVAGAFMIGALSACNEDSTTNPVSVKPNAPTALQALTTGDSTVKIRWTAPVAVSGATVTGYAVVAEDASLTGGTAKYTRVSTGTEVEIAGLTPGKEFKFSVRALTSSDSSAVATINWASARRFVLTYNGNPIRVYERSSSFASGLKLYDSVAGVGVGPRALVSTNNNEWDLALDSANQFGSPSALSYVINPARVTQVNDTLLSNVTGLNDAAFYRSFPLNTKNPGRVTIPDNSGSFGFILKTQDNNFARVYVKNTGGKVLQGTAPNRYIEMEVSYQRTVNLPYAR